MTLSASSNRLMVPSKPPLGFPSLPDDWLIETDSFLSADNKTHLSAHIFRPKNWQGEQSHRAMVILHGQGEHGGRYTHFPHFLSDTIHSFYALDHKGHGQSSGRRGHVNHFDHYADDACIAIRRYYDFLMEKFGKSEIHLLGHSMGGQIAIRAMLKDRNLPIKSVCLSSPMFDLNFTIPKFKEVLGKLLLKVAPSLSLPGEPLADLVSSDPNVCEHYKNDSLNHGVASPSFYFSSLEAKKDSLNRADEIDYPCLILVAGNDRIIDPQSITSFFEKMSDQCDLKTYNDMYHEVFNEPDKEQVFSDLKEWVKKNAVRV